MIKLNSIRIEEFRGIRDITLQLSGKNFGIYGPNGTGKSGVVDAIEFCLTGNVTRLSGEGTAGISVRNHAPHVDQKDYPEKSRVTLSAHIPKIQKSVTITRNVKTPSLVEVTPSDSDVQAVLNSLQTHPEFALSRREIVKYIMTQPAKRSTDVQTLLRLGRLEELRKSLKKFSNKCNTDATQKKSARRTAETSLANSLGLETFRPELVLANVNDSRQRLGLDNLTELTGTPSLTEGLNDADKGIKPPGTTLPPLAKKTALLDLSQLRKEISSDFPDELRVHTDAMQKALEKLHDDATALTIAHRHGFFRTGLGLVTEDACPLCDRPWDKEELVDYLQQKLLSSKKIDQLITALDTHIAAVYTALSNRVESVERAIGYCEKLDPPIGHVDLDSHVANLKSIASALGDFQQDRSLIKPVLHAAYIEWWTPAPEVSSQCEQCYSIVEQLPDESPKQTTRDFLVAAQARYETLVDNSRAEMRADRQASVAHKVLEHYENTSKVVLDEIYDSVADDLSNYYRIINRGDEEQFVGKLESAAAKLNFNVDFYGRGLFPPGAYHSEGHQDGMGLCLYLALMKGTLGKDFTFAVLDDVLMSVDSGHRREVCRLLQTQFPGTQFILTTHDRVWLNYMKAENLIGNSRTFGGWTVDSGPRIWEDYDVWTEIQAELDKENVPTAAALLRRFLEYTASILADNLRAPVKFRGDGRYDLSDLMPPALKEWRKQLEKGQESAQSWGHSVVVAELKQKRATAKKLVGRINVEQWAINSTLHFNEWANLDSHEFTKVVATFRELHENLRCGQQACKSYVFLSLDKGKPVALRCNCGSVNINLKPKPKK